MKRLFTTLFIFLTALHAQNFVASKRTVLTGATEVLTVQATSSSKRVAFVSAYVYCTVACTITLERNGTAATTTTQTPTQVNPSLGIVATATAYNTSNVGVGTVLWTYDLAGSQGLPINLAGISFAPSAGNTNNITFRTSSISGTVNLSIQWQELAQ